MKLFDENPTMSIATSTVRGTRFVSEATAICKYYIDGICVYQASDGSFYYHPMPKEQMGFFPCGQVELLSELELADDYYADKLAILQRDDAALRDACGMSVVMVVAPDDCVASFVIYHEALQVYFFIGSCVDLDLLTVALRMELEKMTPSANTLATPHKVTIDDFGDVSRLEAFEL